MRGKACRKRQLRFGEPAAAPAPAALVPLDAERSTVVKVIASSVRKGNVLEVGGKLCVVMKAENIHPGKGTPVTHLDMRRISDGVKITERYRTTDQVERAYLEDKNFNYLYEDDMAFHFMEPETFEQIAVPKDIIGDQSVYLQENMSVNLSLHEGVPVAAELPQRVTFEIVEADPVVKGQTASSSYKPAVLSNGQRVMVPPHISAGTRVVIMTEDGSYVERAKD
ncbi:MAG: elongation factor P [Sphingomonadales bacterium]|nr:elongation factor P [Sphingomonadales bacterium]